MGLSVWVTVFPEEQPTVRRKRGFPTHALLTNGLAKEFYFLKKHVSPEIQFRDIATFVS